MTAVRAPDPRSGQALRFIVLLGVVSLFAGRWSDRTRRYWAVAYAGYAVNLVAVPLLAFAGSWGVAAGLMLAERVGKGVRTPARDVLLASAAEEVGSGWGFGLHEAMDQIGAVAGPLVMAFVALSAGGYRAGFALLAVPAVLSLLTLPAARRAYRAPRRVQAATPPAPGRGFARPFWLYMVVLVPATLLVAGFAPLAFLGGPVLAFSGIALWGIGMGAHESVMRAAVTAMTPEDRRGTAFGTFNTVFGVCWFAGSALLGILYDRSILWLVTVSVAAQLLALPFLVAAASGARMAAGRAP